MDLPKLDLSPERSPQLVQSPSQLIAGSNLPLLESSKESFLQLSFLGRGQSGFLGVINLMFGCLCRSVYKCCDLRSLGVVAVKKVKITDENSFLQITNEISTLVDMMKGEAGAHPHLVSLVEVS